MPDWVKFFPVWAQGALWAGIVGGGIIWAIIRGARGAQPEMSVTRSDFMEAIIRETQISHEILRKITSVSETTRDATTTTRDLVGRIVATQEAIVRIMQDKAEDDRFVERTSKLMRQLSDREREPDTDHHGRKPHSD